MSSVSSLSSRLSVNGLITGLDTDKLLEGLLAVKQAQISRLEAKQKDVLGEQTAFKGIEARLLTLQSQLTSLSRSQNGVFDARKAVSGNEDLLAAAATSSAAAGTYTFRVGSLARSHAVASQGFDSASAAITQGTITLGVGSASTTITIDATNNTLQGLANAINGAEAGVTASIINDGRGDPYRLLLTADKTGTANAITITNNLAASGGGAVKPDFASKLIGTATPASGNVGTSAATSGGTYTGTTNNTYTFTVTAGGTVGTDTVTLSYSDRDGSHAGTVTVNAADLDTFKTVAEGVQIKFGAGTLVAGDKFTIDTSVATVQAASDATLSLGALSITSSDNTVDDFIPGVTLDLKAADPTKDVTVTVSNDVAGAREAILDFVESYNDFIKSVEDNVRFDAQTQRAGALLGDRTVLSVQDQVRNAAVGAVAGLGPQINRLGAVGITTNDKGQLTVNASKLDDALNGRLSGVGFGDVRRLFALGATSSSSGVQFVTGSTRTKADGTAVQVEITQAARQAVVTATNSLAATTVITGANNQFTIKVDGKTSGTITLADGSYSRAALAQAVEAQVNADDDLFGHKVGVTLDGDKLKFTSEIYGSSSEVTAVAGGTALAALGLAGTETAKGGDVVGRFLVNGVTETATGSGQFLIGATGNATTADLQVRVTLTDAQLDAVNPEANLTVTRGVASKLEMVLNQLLDPIDGRLKTINDTFQKRVDDLVNEEDRQNEIMESQKQSLLKKFIALETTVSQLRTSGDFLTAQINALRNITTR